MDRLWSACLGAQLPLWRSCFALGDCKTVPMLARSSFTRARHSGQMAVMPVARSRDAFFALVATCYVMAIMYGLAMHICLYADMSCIVSCREHEPSTMSPLIRSLLSRIVLGQPSKPTVQLQRVPTFNFLAEDILGASDLRTSDQPGAAGELKEIAAVQESGQQGAQAS